MKILHFSALDGQTGAGVAAARIHAGLLERGVDSRFCVAYAGGGLANAFTPKVTLPGRIIRSLRQAVSDRLLAPYARGYDYVLSTGMVGYDIRRVVAAERPDVVHLHWIAGNSFRLATLAGIHLPIVWRLSDMWPFCGVAHLEPDQTNYIRPLSKGAPWSLKGFNLPESVRHRKAAIYRSLPNLTLAAPGRWMLAEAKRSALLGEYPIEHIPTSCDTTTFSLRDRRVCREVLDLPQDARLILIGATSMGTRWKGGDLFVDAMRHLVGEGRAENVRIATFGNEPLDAPLLKDAVGFEHIGPVRDRRLMAMIYNAADVFVAPSRMENLANAVLESLACGTPVVAFDIGGMPDAIDHEVNGYLAPAFDAQRMAEGIVWALGKAGEEAVRQAARNKILTTFSLEQEIDKYMDLYARVLRKRTRRPGTRGAGR